jgi:hypothetical protein
MKADTKVRIYFPLPFYLPIEENNQIGCHYSGFALFKFFCDKIINSSNDTNEVFTLITIDFLLEKNEDIEIDSLMRVAVINSIIYLNNFIDSFRLVNNLNFIKNFTITDLPPIINIDIDGENYSYVTTPTSILQDKSYNLELLNKTLERFNIWSKHRYFEVIDKFLSKAIYHLYAEDFVAAIIELQTSFECFIRLCHNLILIHQNADEAKIEAAKEYPLKNTLIDHIGKALDEDFDFIRNPLVNGWYENLYKLRNRIVHSGYCYVSGNEGYLAYESLEKIVSYINNLMVMKGFMEIGGNVEINKLNKNTQEDVDFNAVIDRLKEKGLI